MNGYAIYVAHYLQKAQEWVGGLCTATRERMFQYLLGIEHARPMLLLKNGDWVYASASLRDSATHEYDPDRHAIVPINYMGPMSRFPWLVVMGANGLDMSDFYSTLRTARGHDVSVDKVLRLFVQQKRIVPSGRLAVTKRTGDQIEVDAMTGRVLPSYDVVDVSQIDFVR
jgi:hypothetical protein